MVSSFSLRTSRPRPGMYLARSPLTTSYRSLLFGYEVDWSSPWSVAGAEGNPALGSDPHTDCLVLDMHGAGRAQVSIVGAARCNFLDSGETVRFWTSEAYLSEYMTPGTVVVLSDHSRTSGGVVMVSPAAGAGSPVVTVKETYELGSVTSVRVTLTADLAAFHKTCLSMSQALRIDQQGLLRVFTSDVLLAVLS